MATSTSPQPPPDGLPQPARGRAMLVIVLGITLAVLDGSIVNLALPAMARQLQATAAQSIWVVNAYQICTLILLLPLASLGERIGYRRVYLVGMAVFALSSVDFYTHLRAHETALHNVCSLRLEKQNKKDKNLVDCSYEQIMAVSDKHIRAHETSIQPV